MHLIVDGFNVELWLAPDGKIIPVILFEGKAYLSEQNIQALLDLNEFTFRKLLLEVTLGTIEPINPLTFRLKSSNTSGRYATYWSRGTAQALAYASNMHHVKANKVFNSLRKLLRGLTATGGENYFQVVSEGISDTRGSLNRLTQHAAKCINRLKTESDTLRVLVFPFLVEILGFNVFDIDEVRSEVKKGKGRVDLMLTSKGESTIVEVKKTSLVLKPSHRKQLLQYWDNTVSNAILTNGRVYEFYISRRDLELMKPSFVIRLNVSGKVLDERLNAFAC